MVKLAMMVIDFFFWQDFTFADDVMAGLSISQRAKYSTKVMKAFKEWPKRGEGIKFIRIWKREWRPRLSGILKGQYIPHFHLLYFIEGVSSAKYFKLAVLFLISG